MLKRSIKSALRNAGFEVHRIGDASSAGTLTDLADRFGSDKGSRFDANMFSRIYERLFAQLRDKPLIIVEVGLLRSDADKRRAQCAAEGQSSCIAHSAPSLEMWRAYFPAATIIGFDIDDFSSVTIDRCRTVRGDIGSRADLAELAQAAGGPIDILIEDASHASHHQQTALGFLFPHIANGGMYIIEDLGWQPEIEPPGSTKTRDILRRAQAGIPIDSSFMTESEKAYLWSHLDRVMLFDSMTKARIDDSTDCLAVLFKSR